MKFTLNVLSAVCVGSLFVNNADAFSTQSTLSVKRVAFGPKFRNTNQLAPLSVLSSVSTWEKNQVLPFVR